MISRIVLNEATNISNFGCILYIGPHYLDTKKSMFLSVQGIRLKIDSSGHIEELNSLLRPGPKFPVDGLYFKIYFVTSEYTPVCEIACLFTAFENSRSKSTIRGRLGSRRNIFPHLVLSTKFFKTLSPFCIYLPLKILAADNKPYSN